MTATTFKRRLAQLMQEVHNHEHKDEILKLAMEQLCEDVDLA